ncbi:hypothetical protein SERLA73DRAFT_146477 [Serpula lacrymans var. lacrymans S7.3]|uniref:DUF155 domain-containing protein n=2 Tax=Serpula lacrymans var. lacrymans TaxID=341189 RepID=F8QFN2_SERL3|nr:uncharacterized protein SERLADRAFT_378973 [Serpula lacrymans var. lacrymans S7.9]EGN92866.1 hypothetical protein SERLA73DRAFT_146477 [Serpula lacrymans var. lacrymans S7.3]EGO29698.1 hypothetical protein SERLADRAFT_378973 [Serpula lacrymans var. lacrymans S7.9]
MSRPSTSRQSSNAQLPRFRSAHVPTLSNARPSPVTRRTSVSGLTAGAQKAQRTSKTSQKLVLLPSAPQTKPLRADEDDVHGYETDTGFRDHKSEGERMTKEQRQRAGFKRITAYCISESFKMKLLASFLKREHNVSPRVFDEAMYILYHLPLLPGYGPNSNIRSSAPLSSPRTEALLTHMSEAEENGYQGSYFATPEERSPGSLNDGYMTSGSPVEMRRPPRSPQAATEPSNTREPQDAQFQTSINNEDQFAEAIFFAYGVVVFFGLEEGQERGILEDIDNAGVLRRPIEEDDWEIEECHFAHDPLIAYPRIYNDFFTFKSPSHLLKLSVAHALAQSTLLAHYETNAQRVLSDPRTVSIPRQLASSGAIQLKRKDALRITGRLFKLRRDINLVSNVLDVPELFWSEASLKDLYDAVREYMEIPGRVQVLNEKLGVASEFLDAIHDHLNNNAMERITWIVIWLIVVAILVELGEVIARLIVHATMGTKTTRVVSPVAAFRTLQRLVAQK